jgi:hypothetical protein
MGQFEEDYGVAKAWMGISLFDALLFKLIWHALFVV